MNWFIFDKNRMLKFVLGIIIFVLCFPNSSHAQSDSINEVTLKYEHRIKKDGQTLYLIILKSNLPEAWDYCLPE